MIQTNKDINIDCHFNQRGATDANCRVLQQDLGLLKLVAPFGAIAVAFIVQRAIPGPKELVTSSGREQKAQ